MTTVPLSDAERDMARLWWIYLIMAAGWFLLTVIVFRFDWTTVSSISILFGIVMICAALAELVGVFTARGWWRVANGALALAFGVLGIASFIHPGNTFAALAAIISFYFIIRGGFNIAIGIGFRREDELWWFTLILGIAELLLGFWAAGYFGRSALLLVVWVAATALTRGISDVMTAFAIRSRLAS